MAGTKSRKAIHVPEEGEFLSDGTRLVEVVGKCRAGLTVLDVTEPMDANPEILPVDEALTGWRIVRSAA